MQVHELKIKEEYYRDVALGRKTFELRKNDRNYQVGDLIKFNDALFVRESEKSNNKDCWCEEYCPAPSETLFVITYILKDVPEYGLDKDYCILGLRRVEITEYDKKNYQIR